jgi:hypothetical protein
VPSAIPPPQEIDQAGQIPPMFAMRSTGSPPQRAMQEMLGAAKAQVTPGTRTGGLCCQDMRRQKAGRDESIQGAVSRGNAQRGRAIDDTNPQVVIDSDLTRETGVRLEVGLTG